MRTKFFLLIILIFVLIPNFILAQFTQQGSKLVGNGATGNANQGSSVAISGDGNTAIIGGYKDSSGTGAAWIFTRNNDEWSQQGQKLVGSDTTGLAFQGSSVAISADGNTAIVGSPSSSNGLGGAFIFIRSNGIWSQQGSKLIGSGASGSDVKQGSAVAISADGNTVVIGGKNDGFWTGAIWVFTRSSGVWSQQGPKLIGSDAVGQAFQGSSVAISADGNTIVEGGFYDSMYQGVGQGAIWVFTRTNDVWKQQGQKLAAAGISFGQQGSSVAISADGKTIVEGGATYNGSDGGMCVFARKDTSWTQQSQWLAGWGDVGSTSGVVWDPVMQGSSVAISADGNTFVEGGYGDDNWKGAIWVFTRTDSVWTQEGTKLTGSDTVGTTIYQGITVAISGDGKTILEGGSGDNNKVGAAWSFFNPITGVNDNIASTPIKFSLEQNYPNPFNPSTVISYQLPVSSFVNIKVYDLLGREVSTLVNEEQQSGNHEVTFDGSKLASGIYLYTLQSGSFVQTKKMLLMK